MRKRRHEAVAAPSGLARRDGNRAGQHAQSVGIALGTAVEQHLLADTHAEQRLGGGRAQHRRAQTSLLPLVTFSRLISTVTQSPSRQALSLTAPTRCWGMWKRWTVFAWADGAANIAAAMAAAASV